MFKQTGQRHGFSRSLHNKSNRMQRQRGLLIVPIPGKTKMQISLKKPKATRQGPPENLAQCLHYTLLRVEVTTSKDIEPKPLATTKWRAFEHGSASNRHADRRDHLHGGTL
jgi:hypothetical protein